MGSGRGQALAVWLVGLALYVLAVFHRSSLAVAGLVASERFGINASQLATFATLQLLVYAGLQVPVGVALDRFGPRRMLVLGTITLIVAQTAFAFAETYLVAVVARIFVGVGDALTFVCVLRLVHTWFEPRRIPLMTQLTGVLGQAGAIAAAVPMTWGFRHLGWTRSYLVAAAVSLVLLMMLLLVVRDSPSRWRERGAALTWPHVRAGLRDSWAHPGTRLGFWTHFTTQFSATAFALLWGYPFLVRGQGLSSETAGALLTLLVVAIMAAGPVLAWAVTRWPWHRSDMVLGIVASIAATWTVVLVWPGSAPLSLLAVLVIVMGVGGPASMIGFDFGREFNPAHRLGAATGIINQGGFVASLLLVVAIGLVLDWQTPGRSTAYTPEAFRWAMSCHYVLWAVGMAQIWRQRRRARALVAQSP